jgi:uncharacterized protein YcbK (DUF882 family)
MKITLNFSKAEFESKDGALMPPIVLQNINILAVQLQALRNEIKKPIKVTSAYRSPSHNKAIGGVKNSQHILGKACDIIVQGMTPIEVTAVIESLILSGKMLEGGIGTYSNFTHYDFRAKKTRWKK